MRMRSERGTILVIVSAALLALTLFSAVVVDYGLLWVSRNQAQNTADAAALAGAWARVLYDQSSPPSSKTSGIVWQNVTGVAGQNAVWGAAPPSSSVTLDWTCPQTGTTDCVVVDVYRDGTHGSQTLPAAFAQLAGITSQHVRAHAVAWVTGANGTGCIRPWFLIDKYVDSNGNGKYDPGEPVPGYQVPQDLGARVDFHANLSPSGYGEVRLDGPGGSDIRDAIEHCAFGGPWSIGESIPTKPGGTQGPVNQGVDTVTSWDPNATVQYSNGSYQVLNSCATSNGGCTCDGSCPNGPHISPRIFIVPVCSPAQADCAAGGPNNGSITVTNFLSFFMDGWELDGKNVISATLIGTAGEYVRGGGAPTAPFLHIVQLIR